MPKYPFARQQHYPGGVFLVRDNWEGRGYRVYHADSAEDNICRQVWGEIEGEVFRTVGGAAAALRAWFGNDIEVYRDTNTFQRKLHPTEGN